ncbi:hypothetical protein [Motiliproteus sp. MSK22-1]|uniref:hypothetical protein n=1 Tax=Motiliproteus sp. MSK22-1 TaxID=1897630 RepID=UPI00117D52FA|nr:hypothetical protein [Motiliproteus sp. MSK22-1]
MGQHNGGAVQVQHFISAIIDIGNREGESAKGLPGLDGTDTGTVEQAGGSASFGKGGVAAIGGQGRLVIGLDNGHCRRNCQ